MKKINRFFSGVCVLISLLSACIPDYTDDSDSQNTSTKIDEYWMFIGGYKTGKTTIIDSLLKNTKSPNYLRKNLLYIEHGEALDGLDIQITHCAKKIEEGLKENGKYRIFFVLNLDQQNVRASDLNSIETVLDAIDLPNIEFNIIVNKFDEKDKKYFEDKSRMSRLLERLNAGKYKTNNIIFIPLDVDILNGHKDLLTFEKDVLDFMYKNSASIFIPKEKVGHINVDKWYERVEDMKQRLRKI